MVRRRAMMFRTKISSGGEDTSGAYVVDLNDQ